MKFVVAGKFENSILSPMNVNTVFFQDFDQFTISYRIHKYFYAKSTGRSFCECGFHYKKIIIKINCFVNHYNYLETLKPAAPTEASVFLAIRTKSRSLRS